MSQSRAPTSMACPSRDAVEGAVFPGVREERRPPVDERLAPPETGVEYLGGEWFIAAPADEPHATRHSDLTHVVRAHVAPSYKVAVDMLTRTGPKSDFAPDTSVFPADPDPQTGGRRLEELAFEVASEQALSVTSAKARELVRRGVRRVFCLVVKQQRMFEWSRAAEDWVRLPEDAFIEDRCLVTPLPVRALLDAADVDDAVAHALLLKAPAPIKQALTDTRLAGELEGELAQARRAVLTALEVRGLEVPDLVRAEVSRCSDLARLEQWHRRAITATSAIEAVDVGGPMNDTEASG
ncbi:Uma2 family endonuclease [Sorangium sp. So ce1151]|uniref:Uma2 family endonuclease n=1 Tax=Sorangium sp. So ce1151 TaxID=3133332 RepID=UPI003F62F0E6